MIPMTGDSHNPGSPDRNTVVIWIMSQGASRVLALTLGHKDDEWRDPVFLKLLENGVNFLIGSE